MSEPVLIEFHAFLGRLNFNKVVRVPDNAPNNFWEYIKDRVIIKVSSWTTHDKRLILESDVLLGGKLQFRAKYDMKPGHFLISEDDFEEPIPSTYQELEIRLTHL
jgi:hypothetical protein